MSESREEVNAQIIGLLNNIQSALEEKNLDKAKTLTNILSLFSAADVDRAVNPVDPDVQKALLERVEYTVKRFVDTYATTSSVTFVKEITLLAQTGRIPPEVIKPLLKPAILLMIKQGDKEIGDLKQYI